MHITWILKSRQLDARGIGLPRGDGQYYVHVRIHWQNGKLRSGNNTCAVPNYRIVLIRGCLALVEGTIVKCFPSY